MRTVLATNAPLALEAREVEVGILQAAVDALAHGRGSLVSLFGPAGIGKTRLANEIGERALAAGVSVHWGRAWPGAGAPPFWPWTQVVRSILIGLPPAERDNLFSPFADELAHVLESKSSLDPGVAGSMVADHLQFRVFDAVAGFLSAVAARGPRLIVLDDLHDADASTLQLLRFLAPSLPSLPIAVVATIREHEARASEHSLAFTALSRAGRVVRVPPLTSGHIATLAAKAGFEISAAVADTLHRLSSGVPYYIEAILRQIRVERPAGGRLDASSLRVTEEVGDAALYAVARLEEPVLDLLGSAAVVGLEFSGDFAARAHGISLAEGEERLAVAARLGAIEPIEGAGGLWRFVHAILREALYRRIPEMDRAHRHERLAQALIGAAAETPRGAAEIATHLLAAAIRGDSTSAIEWSLRAAAEAEGRCAYDDAAEWFDRALRAADARGHASLARLALEGLARAQGRVGETDASRASYERLWQDAVARADVALQGRVALGLAGPPLLPVGFELPIARPSSEPRLREALRGLGDADTGLRAMVKARLAAEICEQEGIRETAQRLSLDALAEAEASGDLRSLSYCLALRHVVGWGSEMAQERLVLIDRIEDLARTLADADLAARAQTWRVSCLFEVGETAAVERQLSEWRERGRLQPHPLYAWYLPLFEAGLALLRGSFRQAEELAHRAMQDGFRLGALDAVFANGVQQFFLRRELGTLSTRRTLVRGLAETYPASTVIRSMLAFLYAEIGELEAAREELERLADDDFRAVRRNTLWLGYTCMLSEVCVALGDRQRAERLFAMLAPHAEQNGIVGAVFVGAVTHYLSRLGMLLGRRDEAAEFARRACLRHEALNALPFLVRSRLAYADAIGGEAALDLRGRAGDIAERIGMALPPQPPEPPAGEDPARKTATVARTPETARFARRGEGWELEFAGARILLPRLLGCDHIEYLLRRPGVDVAAIELLDAPSVDTEPSRPASRSAPALAAEGLRRDHLGDSGPRLDAAARRAYRLRMEELRSELAEAEANSDLGRIERVQEEIELLRRELSAAVGLGGRVRNDGAALERARLTITKRIKAALQKIEQCHKPLARFLSDSIRTGVVCRYVPPPDRTPSWRFD